MDKNKNRKISDFFRKREVLTCCILIAIWLIISLFNKNYFTTNNFCVILRTLSYYGIIVAGLSLVIIQGDRDMSTGGSCGFSAVLGTAIMYTTNCFGMQGTDQEWLGILLTVLIMMVIGACIGAFIGFTVVTLNLPAFIATTAARYILQGCIMIVCGGSYIYPLPDKFVEFGKAGIPIGKSVISVHFLIALFLLILILGILMRKTKWGRSVYQTGSNRISAELAGIKTAKVRYISYMILHALCALSGMCNAAYLKKGDPNIGRDWELTCVAACVIGGVKMSGGVGNATGLIIGLLTFFSINSAIAYLGLNTFLQDVVVGVVLLVIMISDSVTSRQKIRA